MISNFEYVFLRLLRRFLFNLPPLKSMLGWVPYYFPSRGETDPESILALYKNYLSKIERDVTDQTILEIGSGVTNATAYALIAGGGGDKQGHLFV